MILNGRVGQVLGPFAANVDLLAEGGAISDFTPEASAPIIEKLGIQTDVGNLIEINGVQIKIGKTGIYELDNRVAIKSLKFPNGANTDTIIDFVY